MNHLGEDIAEGRRAAPFLLIPSPHYFTLDPLLTGPHCSVASGALVESC